MNSTNITNTSSNVTRRTFLGAALGAAASAPLLVQQADGFARTAPAIITTPAKPNKLKLTFKPYTLDLKHAFNVAVYSRTTTPVVLTQIEYGEGTNRVVGYGEASMPPYLGETQDSVMKFLSQVAVLLGNYENPLQLETILNDVDAIAPDNTAAKASVDIALHDLVGKIMGQPLYNIWGFDKSKTPNTTFTIGIDKQDVIREKMKETTPFKIIKVKIGQQESDRMMIETVRSMTDKPLVADANQGWKDKQYALDTIHWLKEKGVQFIEQPLPKDMVDENAWITERSPMPVITDEAVKRLPQIMKAKGVYHGINIKLMKCTGVREAHKMITLARALGMKVMIGCMTETSCAISAAAHLTPMVDWADLDGSLLIKNDAFTGMTVVDGKITLPDRAGIGVVPV